MQKILVVGATGNLGPHLVRALADQGKEVHALIRPQSIQNPQKINPLRAMGVHLAEGDLNDPGSLRRACSGMDAVISAAGGGQLMQQQALIEAAKAAGVKRFIPSEFGVDPYASGLGSCDLFDAKAAVQQMVKSSGLPYTMIYANGFMEFWGIGLGQIGHMSPPEEVAFYGSGDVKASIVALPDIARFTSAVLDDKEAENQEVRITANVMSQQELITAWEKISGTKVKRNLVAPEELERIIKDSTSPDAFMTKIVAQLHRSVWLRGDCMKIRPETMEATRMYPHLPLISIEAFFSKLVKVAV